MHLFVCVYGDVAVVGCVCVSRDECRCTCVYGGGAVVVVCFCVRES